VTIVDFSVTVPVLGDTFNISYCPLILAGSQVSGAGKVFENLYDIDFSNPFNIGGIPNRLIIPNFNSNGTLINYTITKREIVTNGFSRIFKKVINTSDVRPFLEIVLPEDNVLSVDSIITLQGTNFNSVPTSSQFTNQSLKWYEVDALAENKVFVEDFNRITELLKSDGFLLSGSSDIDNYFKSITNKPFFTELYTTLSFPIYSLNIKDDMKCFYVGINWDLITNSKGRYTDLLKLLDNENLVNIYGPKIIHNINVFFN
jgi:hypothetical protein